MQKECTDLQLKLTDPTENQSDINGKELYEELRAIEIYLKPEISPMDILVYIYENNLSSSCSNLVIVLRIFLTVSNGTNFGRSWMKWEYPSTLRDF